MRKHPFLLYFGARFLLCFLIFSQCFSCAAAYEYGTLYNGCKSEEVQELQEALISLGYLKGTADGVFGNNTENAVRKFQKKNKLVSDGLAGEKTRSLILSQAGKKQASSKDASKDKEDTTADKQDTAILPSGSLFSGNYGTLRRGSKGDRVRIMQQALISLGYLSGRADGVFGSRTRTALIAFQKSRKLSADGVAGKKTLLAIENAVSGKKDTDTPVPDPTPVPSSEDTEKEVTGDLNDKISGPSAASVQLLHWYNTVKPSLSGGKNYSYTIPLPDTAGL